jgi:lysophospholipid acyltransferase (LPLAT)-like uncharacterized protein
LERRHRWRRLLGALLGSVARVWLGTLRLRVAPRVEDQGDESPIVFAFFHGHQFPLLAWKHRRKTAVMVSLSADGEMQGSILAKIGFAVTRGSSSRGGARALVSLVKQMRTGLDAAFAVDGPRGPRGVCKPGALMLARNAGAKIVPMGSAATSAYVFHQAWDRYILPEPFATVGIALGEAMDPNAIDEGDLARAIDAENTRAAALLTPP